ncbi:MAG: hypothetical protein QXD43_02020 [Candidatus Aenigmatarchaeota archaeon]
MKVKEILNIVLINLTVFFALISIHEIGHTVSGLLLNCRYQKSVLLDHNFVGPYTEMYCSNINYFFVFLSSLALTTFFSFLFLFLNPPTKNLFFISQGFSLIFSSLDLSIATNISSLFYPLIALGFLITSAGEYFIATSYVKNNFSLDLLDID